MTTVHFTGGSIEVNESYVLVQQRVDRALRAKQAFETGEEVTDTKGKVIEYRPSKYMDFTTPDDGRFSLNIEKYICVASDEPTDKQ